MPELPEVETIRRGLEPAIAGQVIGDVEVRFSGSFDADLEYIAACVVGAGVTNVTRRGKVLIINLDNEHSLLIHLKMTGQLVLDSVERRSGTRNMAHGTRNRFAGGHPTTSMTAELPDNSTRVIFTFDNGGKLFFNDQRKFGWIKLVPTAEVNNDPLLLRLGPEPLEAAFALADFTRAVSKRNAPIKAVLLDQSTLAGLGNIYVDEVLHLAKIHPQTSASDLPKAKLEKLQAAIIEVLESALGYGGTSFTNYVNALGVKGNYLENARVFKREGLPCPVCGATIEKIRVAGRGTHVCPKCQNLSK